MNLNKEELKAEIKAMRKRLAHACGTNEEIEKAMQIYAELCYLLLNGEFLEDE